MIGLANFEQDRVCTGPMKRLRVVPGLAMPFFPARPMTGTALQNPDQAVQQYCRDMDQGYVCQPKINGDRACLGVVQWEGLGITDKIVVVQNRHGGWTSQCVKNAGKFFCLGVGTCLDGEILKGNFHPFECLAISGVSLLQWPTIERVAMAQSVCDDLKVDWLFAPMGIAQIKLLRKNLPLVEGYVRKANTAYPIGSSSTSETQEWTKHRW